MKKFEQNKAILGLYLIFMAIICYLVLRNIGSLNSITIISDEFGYWYAGSVFAGLDWREVAYLNPYYGFGYGLLLCPLFWLFDDAILMYRIAIGYNAIFMMTSFVLGIKIMDKLELDIKREWKLFISFAVTVYSNLVYQSQTTQVECLLNCLFWLMLYCFINIVQRHRYLDYICMALVCGYMYAVHMRSIGGVLSGVLIIMLFACTHKGLWKRTLVYLGIVSVLLLAVEGVKAEIKDNTYAPLPEYHVQSEKTSEEVVAAVENQNNAQEESSDMQNINDYTSVMGNVGAIFSVNGLQKLFVHIVGKFYYLFAASLLIIFYSVITLYHYICKGVQAIYKKRESDDLFWISLFLGMTLLFAIGIASVFLLDYSRQDMIVYGRYSEYVIGPLLMLGLYLLLKRNISIESFYIAGIVEVILAFIVQNAIRTAGLKEYLDNNAVGLVSKIIYVFGDLGNKEFAVPILAFILLQSFAVWGFFRIRKGAGSVIAIVLCAAVWIADGTAVYEHNTLKQQARLVDTVSMADYLKTNAYGDTIYYVDEPVPYTTVDYIQFQLLQQPIRVVEPNQLNSGINPGYYIVNSESQIFRERKSACIRECKHFRLYYFAE